MRLLVLLLALTASVPTWAQQNAPKAADLAATPPMGWNSWNTFACDIDESLIRETADAIVASGMRDAGYTYVNIDDCWHGERDADGFIQPDPERFPSGMRALADYVHSLDLKLGIYSDAGTQTCAGRPGSQGYEYQDALQYARWGIDYLKYDWCNTEGRNAPEAYRTMRNALAASGRDIFFSICEWGDNQPWTWAKDIGHMWRTSGDIINCWDCVVSHGNWNSWGVMRILDMQVERGLRVHAAPGHWNDPDMMEVGNMPAPNEDRAHFAMWAMLHAPLIAGNDVRSMTEVTREILTNQEVIALDQDPLGVEGFPHKRAGGVEVWFKPLADGDWAMAILNRNDDPRAVTFDWPEEHVEDAFSQNRPHFDQHTYAIRDLFRHADAGTTASPLAVTVPGRDVWMVRLTRAGG
ncbi:MAG: alpha-galactosidase [Rhodothermaceae bacterium]|nr:alpha-galactosidase [Rhodothermaceae bacterium]